MSKNTPEKEILNFLLKFNNNNPVFEYKGYRNLYSDLPAEFQEKHPYYKFKRVFDENKFSFDKTKFIASIKPAGKLSRRQLINNIKNKSKHNVEDKQEDFKLKILDLSTIQVCEDDFKPLKTGKGIDTIFSLKGGIMPGTSIVLIGNPGAGKTTNGNQILSDIKENNPQVEIMSLSTEMKQIDIEEELLKNKWMKNVPHVLFSHYKKEQYKQVLEEVFLYGYDVLLFDSFQNTTERLKNEMNMTSGEASNYLMGLIEMACDGKTKTKKKTAVLIIQQVTKSGDFAGKNNLKHDTTGMLHFNINPETNERSCFFSKNRRCGIYINKEMYYYMDDNNEIQYDLERFNEDREAERMLTKNKNDLKLQRDVFEKTFLKRGEVDTNDNVEEDLDSDVFETNEEELEDDLIISIANKSLKDAAEETMQVMGYNVIAEGGLIQKVYPDGSKEIIKEIDK